MFLVWSQQVQSGVAERYSLDVMTVTHTEPVIRFPFYAYINSRKASHAFSELTEMSLPQSTLKLSGLVIFFSSLQIS